VIHWLGLELKAALMSYKRNKLALLVSSNVHTLQYHVAIQSALDRSQTVLCTFEVHNHGYL
jgi:hypothetical protein